MFDWERYWPGVLPKARWDLTHPLQTSLTQNTLSSIASILLLLWSDKHIISIIFSAIFTFQNAVRWYQYSMHDLCMHLNMFNVHHTNIYTCMCLYADIDDKTKIMCFLFERRKLQTTLLVWWAMYKNLLGIRSYEQNCWFSLTFRLSQSMGNEIIPVYTWFMICIC